MRSRSKVIPPTEELIQWYRKVHRPLPWRASKDPYSIWISEVMLQQTQVATVIPYYERFLKRFPTVQALAEAEESEVLAAWSGLGYYSRARNLQRGARFIVSQSLEFPKNRQQILAVPGIGPYTAGAILSIAFDLPEPIVEGNVQRVFARFYGVKKPIEEKSSLDFFWEKAREWVINCSDPSSLNQGLMELGATVCTKGVPECGRCPLLSRCQAYEKGLQDTLPLRRPRVPMQKLWWAAILLESSHRLCVVRNPRGSWWEGLWDFPRLEFLQSATILEKVPVLLQNIKAFCDFTELNSQTHTVTHHKITLVPFLCKVKPTWVPRQGEWRRPEEILALPVSALVKKVIRSYITI